MYLEKQRDFAIEETVPLQKDIARTLSSVLIQDPKTLKNVAIDTVSSLELQETA